MIMRIAWILSLLTVAGCGFTQEGDFARLAVKEYGGQAFDEGLINAEWFICNVASIGSIRRCSLRDSSARAVRSHFRRS